MPTHANHLSPGFDDAVVVAELRSRIRQLWTTEPAVALDRRSEILTRLSELDTAVERLELALRAATVEKVDADELVRVRRTLMALEAQWAPAVGRPEEPPGHHRNDARRVLDVA